MDEINLIPGDPLGLGADVVKPGPLLDGEGGSLKGQVVAKIERMLGSGQMDAGGRLPSERAVATDLRVSRNTVTAAYGELEQRGLIRRIRGKGAYRSGSQKGGETFAWSGKISAGAHLLDEPILELLAHGGLSGLPYPLSAGTPAMACFPNEAFGACVKRVVENQFPEALALAPTEGQPRLRKAIAEMMHVETNRVLITAGGQEAIDLLVRCLIEPGDWAIVDSPTYPGAIQCLRAGGAKIAGWETDWNLDKLEELLIRYRPKLIFTCPTFQNPTGKVLKESVRRGLLELAARYHTPVIEDDVYSRSYCDGVVPPKSLYELDKRSQTIYVSTFSKVLAPGLRIGWMVAPAYMVKQISLIKMRANLFTCGLNQLALADMLETGEFGRHLERLRGHHQRLRNAAVAAARGAAEEGLLSFIVPGGGLYLWCRLRAETDLEALLATLEERGLSVAPGHAFYPGEPKATYVRLCYTAAGEPALRKGVEILTGTLREMDAGEPVASR